MNFEFCFVKSVYLSMQEVCPKLLDLEFSYIMFSELERCIYLFIKICGFSFYINSFFKYTE